MNNLPSRTQSRISPQWPPWGRRKWPLWGGRGVIWQFFFCAKLMLIVSHNGNPIIYNNYVKKHYTTNQKFNVTKRASFAIFAISIVNNLHVCLLQQYKCLYTTRHMDQISLWPFLTFSSVAGKNWPLSRSYFGSLEHALVTVAVVERFKQEPMYGLSNGTKESDPCREVAVCGGSTV